MKKVLIALDYDPSAQKVAETGHEIAKAMNAQIVLLHVIFDATYYSSVSYSPIMGLESFNNVVETDNAEDLQLAAQSYLDNTKQHLGDETIQTIIKHGDFGESILNTATAMNIDIIVMGTHGRRGLEKILMGSVAENVLSHTSIPLLIIPTNHIEKKQKKDAK